MSLIPFSDRSWDSIGIYARTEFYSRGGPRTAFGGMASSPWSAQDSHDLPMLHGPVTRKPRSSAIQRPVANCLEQCFVEPARRAVIDVLDRGLAMTQPRGPQAGPKRLVPRLAASRSSSRASHSACGEVAELHPRASSSTKACAMPSSLSALS